MRHLNRYLGLIRPSFHTAASTSSYFLETKKSQNGLLSIMFERNYIECVSYLIVLNVYPVHTFLLHLH